MPKRNNKKSVPYVILGSGRDQDVRFYERYDASFLYNKVVTLLYVIEHEEDVIKSMEEYLDGIRGGTLSPTYLASLRAEIFFSTLHQCETFFAMLLAPFQPLPHWVYLTTYETREIKEAIDKIVTGNIADLTGGVLTTTQELVSVAVYSENVAADPEVAGRWEENLDNAAWIVERAAQFFLDYDRAYNSYKHGLRVMTGPHRLSIASQNPDGSVQGPMRLIQSSDDAVTYLQIEPVREVDGEKEQPVSEVTKSFSPSEACFYLFKMHQMLETARATRLTYYSGTSEGTLLYTYFGLDRDEVNQLRVRSEWVVGPARADEGRAYQQYIDQMRADAEMPRRPENTPPDQSQASS